VHCVRPFVLSLSVLGSEIAICLAVVLLAGSFLTDSVSLIPFGFFEVPAFDGDTEAVPEMDGVAWAYAMPAVPRPRVAAAGAMYVLRKDFSSGRIVLRVLDTGAPGPKTEGADLNNTSATQRFRFYHRGFMRADTPTISAPPFPRDTAWVNVASLRM